MGFFDKFKKKQTLKNEDLEARRIELLERSGRITDGRIMETEKLQNGEEIAYYFYSVQGVDYESSEILSEEKLSDGIKYAAGAKVGVKYDPRNHGNSMLV